MTTFSQSGTNDIGIGADGQFLMATGRCAYANILADAIRTVKGEIQLNTRLGIDYFGSIFDSVSKLELWKSEAESVIMSYGFVNSIVSFEASYNPSTKKLSYKAVILTDDGEVTLEN